MGFIYSTDKTSHSCNFQHSFTLAHTSRNTASMYNKFRIMRKLGALLTLCCFVICGCVTANDSNTRTTLNFSQIASLATQATSSPDSSPAPPQTSSPAPPSPVTSPASPFDLVAQKFEDFVKWRRDCGYQPKRCDVGEFTILGTQFSDDFATMMRDYAKNNIYARPGGGERKIIVETISRDETKMTAIVHGCVYDTVVLYMGAGIYDDKVASSLSSWTLQWHNNDWFWSNYQIHKKVYFANLCNT